MRISIKCFLAIVLALSFSCKQKEENKEAVKEAPVESSARPAKEAQPEVPGISSNDGENIEYYPDGKIKIKGMKKNGMREGRWISLYPDGKTWSECEYKDGLKHGINISYYPSGKKMYEGKYKNDVQTGVWKYFEENGSLSQEVNYDKRK